METPHLHLHLLVSILTSLVQSHHIALSYPGKDLRVHAVTHAGAHRGIHIFVTVQYVHIAAGLIFVNSLRRYGQRMLPPLSDHHHRHIVAHADALRVPLQIQSGIHILPLGCQPRILFALYGHIFHLAAPAVDHRVNVLRRRRGFPVDIVAFQDLPFQIPHSHDGHFARDTVSITVFGHGHHISRHVGMDGHIILFLLQKSQLLQGVGMIQFI